jgi:hypothetical protein
MGTTTNNWLKRIFSVTTLTTVLTIVGTCIAIIQYTERNGGTFVAFLNGKEVTPPVKDTILVYLDKDSADLSQIGIFPQISNPSKYSLQDVLLTYKIVSGNANVSFTDYFSVHRVANGSIATNNDKTLYSKTEMPEPFFYFVMKDQGEASIDLKATYKGVDKPFTFQADIYARKLYRADRDQRKKDIFSDAYDFAYYKKLSNVDLYILEGDKIESFRDVSFEKPHTDNATSVRPTKINCNNEIKTIEQVKANNEEIIRITKENQGTPWYMYIAAISLLVISVFGFLSIFAMISFQLFDEKELNEIFNTTKLNTTKIYIIVFLIIFFSYLSFYYYVIIGNGADDNFRFKFIENSDTNIKFLAGLVSSFLIFLLIKFGIDGLQKLFDFISINFETVDIDENVELIIAIIFMLISVMITFFVYKAIPC